MFQIPAAYGLPTLWKGYGYSRNFESLVALSEIKSEQIKRLGKTYWSATVVDDATLDNIDQEALSLARVQFKEKNQNKPLFDEINLMTDKEFLNKAGLTLDGKITYTTLLLLGKEESAYLVVQNTPIYYLSNTFFFLGTFCLSFYAIFLYIERFFKGIFEVVLLRIFNWLHTIYFAVT